MAGGLSAHDIARLLDMPAAQVSGVLTRFSRRLKRRLPPREHARVERAIVRSARGWLEKQNGGMPDAGAVYRSLEAELMEAGGSTHRVSRVLGRVLAIAVALLLAALFWLFMVLLQPSALGGARRRPHRGGHAVCRPGGGLQRRGGKRWKSSGRGAETLTDALTDEKRPPHAETVFVLCALPVRRWSGRSPSSW